MCARGMLCRKCLVIWTHHDLAQGKGLRGFALAHGAQSELVLTHVQSVPTLYSRHTAHPELLCTYLWTLSACRAAALVLRTWGCCCTGTSSQNPCLPSPIARTQHRGHVLPNRCRLQQLPRKWDWIFRKSY